MWRDAATLTARSEKSCARTTTERRLLRATFFVFALFQPLFVDLGLSRGRTAPVARNAQNDSVLAATPDLLDQDRQDASPILENWSWARGENPARP